MHGRGFTNLSTEFNFDRDPEAAHVVLREYKNITILPIEVEESCKFTVEETKEYRLGHENEFIPEITRRFVIDSDDDKGKNSNLE